MDFVSHRSHCLGIDWTSVVQPLLEKRMQKYSQGEIQFNLMAVVSDRKLMYERELKSLQEVSRGLNRGSIAPSAKTLVLILVSINQMG